jgi:hypothetical protein
MYQAAITPEVIGWIGRVLQQEVSPTESTYDSFDLNEKDAHMRRMAAERRRRNLDAQGFFG